MTPTFLLALQLVQASPLANDVKSVRLPMFNAVPAPTSPNAILSPIDVFTLAEQAKAEGRSGDAFAFYDALTQDRDGDIRAEARFRKAMLLAALNRYREAAVTFRALLDERPDAARVRLELARVLAAMGDDGAARRELRQAQATGLPPQVAQAVGQFDQALRSPRRAGFNLEMALAPDSNMNRATKARTLDTIIAPLVLSQDALAQSGIGLRAAGQGYVKLPVAQGISLVPRASGIATLYREHAFNDISASATLGLEWQKKYDRVSPSLGRTWRWFGGHLYARTDVVAVDWLHSLNKRAQLVVTASAGRANFVRNNLQDGALYALGATVEQAMSSRSGLSVTLSGSRQTANDPGYATVSGGVGVLGWREAGRTTLFASAGVHRTEGDAALLLFGAKRREWFVNGRAGITLRQLTIRGFAPYIRVSYEHNRSTVALYDYQRFATEIGITRAF